MQGSVTNNKFSFVDTVRAIFQLNAIPQLLLIAFLLSIGLGNTAGLEPAIISDRYARLLYAYEGPPCSSIVSDTIPDACSLGSADAQNAASIASFVQFGLTFITSPLIGSLSDRYGRKSFISLGVFLFILAPLALFILEIFPNIDPIFYYTIKTTQGLCGWFIPSFAIITDVAPHGVRAMGFSILVVTTEAGIPIVPILASLFGNTIATGISLIFCFLGLLVAYFFLPETLSTENKEKAIEKMEEEAQNGSTFFTTIFRPVRDLVILNRNYCLRLTAIVYLTSEMMKSGERIMFLFYAQGQIGFNDQDTAIYVLIHAVAGITAQLFLLNWCVQNLGERKTVIVSLTIGTMYSLLYGITSNKTLIFIVTFFSSGAGMCFPTANSIMTFNVKEHEQGTVQGAFSALQAVANSLGPVILNYIFQLTVNGAFLGAGSFFIVGAFFYALSDLMAIALPPGQSNSREYLSRLDTMTALLNTNIGDDNII